jgi:hypothetical protein
MRGLCCLDDDENTANEQPSHAGLCRCSAGPGGRWDRATRARLPHRLCRQQRDRAARRLCSTTACPHWHLDRAASPCHPGGFKRDGEHGLPIHIDPLVLSRKPDLCFIECTTGDSGSRPPLEVIGPAIEGLVRKLRAIECECCILHAYRSDRTDQDFRPLIERYEKVADHYGIPSVHLGRAVNLGLASGELSLEELFLDGIHTTTQGGRVIATLIARALETILSAQSTDAPPLPLRFHPVDFEAARLLRPQTALDPQRCRSSHFRQVLPYLEIEAGNGLVLDATPGKLAGLLLVAGPHAGDIVIEANSQTLEFSTWDEWCDRDLLRSVIFRQPIRRDAKVRLTVTDRGGCPTRGASRIIEVPKLLKLIGFMLYDERSFNGSG